MPTERVKSGPQRPPTGRRGRSANEPIAESSGPVSPRVGDSAISMNSQACLNGEKCGEEKMKNSMIKRVFQGIWSTRYTRTTVDNENLLIKTTLKELITWCVFTLIITLS